MNAAARLVHQHALSRHWLLIRLLSKQQFAYIFMSMALICSAFGMIYTSYLNRMLEANYQQTIVEKNKLLIERGQLLLERSAWMSPVRIQQLAETKLTMSLPTHKSVVIINK